MNSLQLEPSCFEKTMTSLKSILLCVNRRWKTLFPHEVPRFQAASRIKKVALISNFVDREARRPALGPSDFVQLQLLDSVTETGKTDSCRKGEKKSRYISINISLKLSCHSNLWYG